MVTGSKFTLSLAQVERTAVGFSITGYQEYDESDDGRDMALDNQPVPRTRLSLHDTTHLHSSGEHHGTDHTQTERHLVRDELYGTTHGRHHGVLVVTTPASHEDTQHADGADSSHQEDAHIEVEHGHTLVPRQEREGTHTGNHHEEWRHDVEKLISLIYEEDLLDEHLQHVGKHLQQSPLTYSHRSDTALEEGTHLTFHIDEHDTNHCIRYEHQGTHEYALNQNCPETGQNQGHAQQ